MFGYVVPNEQCIHLLPYSKGAHVMFNQKDIGGIKVRIKQSQIYKGISRNTSQAHNNDNTPEPTNPKRKKKGKAQHKHLMMSDHNTSNDNGNHNESDESDSRREATLGPDEFRVADETELSLFVCRGSIAGFNVLGERLKSRRRFRVKRGEDDACANQPERRED